jgi:hypothetical protein
LLDKIRDEIRVNGTPEALKQRAQYVSMILPQAEAQHSVLSAELKTLVADTRTYAGPEVLIQIEVFDLAIHRPDFEDQPFPMEWAKFVTWLMILPESQHSVRAGGEPAEISWNFILDDWYMDLDELLQPIQSSDDEN